MSATLGKIGGDGLYLRYCPLLAYFVSGSRCLPYLVKLTVINSPHHLLSQRIIERIIVGRCQNKSLMCETKGDGCSVVEGIGAVVGREEGLATTR